MTPPAPVEISSPQLRFEYPPAASESWPLLPTPASAAARAVLARQSQWPLGQIALIGEPRSGKTRLLQQWAQRSGAAIVSGADLAACDILAISELASQPLAVDDADRAAHGESLLYAMNLCRERGHALLVAGCGEPPSWFAAPGDLHSRLRGIATTVLEAPDEATLALRLQAECRRRYMRLDETLAGFLAQRMERSYGAIERLADEIDALVVDVALGRRIVAGALNRLGMLELSVDEVSMLEE